MRTRLRSALSLTLAVTVVLAFADQVAAQWFYPPAQNPAQVQMSIGTAVDPANPPSLNGLYAYQNGTVTMTLLACCNAANYCPANWQEGLSAAWTITVIGLYPNGQPWAGSAQVDSSLCPAKCVQKPNTFSGLPGAPTAVSVVVTIYCTCCQGGIEIQDPDDYPGGTIGGTPLPG